MFLTILFCFFKITSVNFIQISALLTQVEQRVVMGNQETGNVLPQIPGRLDYQPVSFFFNVFQSLQRTEET